MQVSFLLCVSVMLSGLYYFIKWIRVLSVFLIVLEIMTHIKSSTCQVLGQGLCMHYLHVSPLTLSDRFYLILLLSDEEIEA